MNEIQAINEFYAELSPRPSSSQQKKKRKAFTPERKRSGVVNLLNEENSPTFRSFLEKQLELEEREKHAEIFGLERDKQKWDDLFLECLKLFNKHRSPKSHMYVVGEKTTKVQCIPDEPNGVLVIALDAKHARVLARVRTAIEHEKERNR